jgi:hypothetical protein
MRPLPEEHPVNDRPENPVRPSSNVGPIFREAWLSLKATPAAGSVRYSDALRAVWWAPLVVAAAGVFAFLFGGRSSDGYLNGDESDRFFHLVVTAPIVVIVVTACSVMIVVAKKRQLEAAVIAETGIDGGAHGTPF